MVLNFYAEVPGVGYNDKFSQRILLHEDDDKVETEVVNIYPELTYETFEGFGGAVTEAAGYVYSLMCEEDKKQVIETYFSQEQMNYRFVRIHMDSCDFSLNMYEAMSDREDTELCSFSFERTEKYILPMLEDAKRIAGDGLKLMLSPWSPPAFMKTNGKRNEGGKLKPEYRKLWAEYICRYIREFKDRGYSVQRISLQNEPAAAQSWDSCLFTAKEEKEFLRDFLYPTLMEHGYGEIEIFIWDHNKERLYERVRDVMDSDTEKMISGAAFHWYSGDHFEAMDLVKKIYPRLKLIMSESCLEYRLFQNKEDIQENAVRLCHEIIGNLNHGMSAFYDWNLLLDEKGGPNHAGNYCHAPFLYDTKESRLMRQKICGQLFQFSHYILPGSVRIATTKYTERLDVTGFKTPEGKIVLVVLNKSDKTLPVAFRISGKAGSLLLPAETLGTCVIL